MLEAARDAGIGNEYTLYSFECGPWLGSDKACVEHETAADDGKPVPKKQATVAGTGK